MLDRLEAGLSVDRNVFSRLETREDATFSAKGEAFAVRSTGQNQSFLARVQTGSQVPGHVPEQTAKLHYAIVQRESSFPHFKTSACKFLILLII